MRPHTIVTFLLLTCCGAGMACTRSPHGDAAMTSAQSPVDSALTAFIAKIRTVDNHTHANTIAPGDSESDALPLEVLRNGEVTRARAEEIATMVLRTNAGTLYKLELK